MKKLYIDIETQPTIAYIWQLKTKYVPKDHIAEVGRTLCFAAKWEGSKDVMFFSEWKDGFNSMIEAAFSLLDEADVVIHYNGEKFDIPILQWEIAKLVGVPPTSVHQVDLYKTVRQNFKMLSYSLDFVCQEFDLGSKLHHKGMELWKEVMDGDAKARKIMERYNVQDVKLLPKLYKRLLPYIKNHPNYGLWLDPDKPCCTNCGSTNLRYKGLERLKTQSYHRYKCKKCGTNLRSRFTVVSREQGKNVLVSR
jgi:hypothetical protein